MGRYRGDMGRYRGDMGRYAHVHPSLEHNVAPAERGMHGTIVQPGGRGTVIPRSDPAHARAHYPRDRAEGEAAWEAAWRR